MRPSIRRVALLGGLAWLPAGAAAQNAQKKEARQEFGVDLGIFYRHEGSLSGTSCSTDCGTVAIATPVDLRVGFVTSPSMSLEVRSTFSYFKNGSSHALTFMPDVNLLYALGGSNQKGSYVTGGLGLFVVSASSSSGTITATQVSFNGGVGTRIPLAAAAWRLEGFFRYNFENSGKSMPNSYDIGTRVGISFFN